MWQLFKNGVPPKQFFVTPEVKQTLKQQIEQNKEDELLDSAKKLAEKYLEKVLHTKKLTDEMTRSAMTKSMSTNDLELLKLKSNLQMDLLTNKPAERISGKMEK